MNNYATEELKRIILHLLKKGHEGDYWDYKREWPDENTDLIKDIISFANTSHNKDCFIIFGAADDGTPYTMMSQRRNQNELLNLIAHIPWAGHNSPLVGLESIILGGHVYDVLIIYNSDRTPFYLQQDYENKIKFPPQATGKEKMEINDSKKKKTLKQGVIYVRTGDNTTPFGEIASPLDIENLWKKRFHLLLPIGEQFYSELENISIWEETEGEIFHSTLRPEFTFQYIPDTDLQPFNEFYVKIFPDNHAYRRIFGCFYYGTKIDDVYTISIDGGRWSIPYPNISLIPFDKTKRFFYFVKHEKKMIVYDFINKNNNDYWGYFESITKYLLLFENEKEYHCFINWLQDKANLWKKFFDQFIAENCIFSSECDKIDAATGKSMVFLLRKYREEFAPLSDQNHH